LSRARKEYNGENSITVGRMFTWSVVKGNGKVVPFHAMKAYRGRRGIAPLIFNLSLDGGEWLALHLGHFTPRKEAGYPLNGRLCGPCCWSGHFGG